MGSEAKENALLNGISERTNVFRLDVLNDEIPAGYDIIVSNPPYIESEVVPTLEVSEFEPHRALDGGDDGLNFYRVIAKKAHKSLAKGGMLALEIGYDQGESVKNLLDAFSEVSALRILIFYLELSGVCKYRCSSPLHTHLREGYT